MIDNSLASVLDDKKISQALRENVANKMGNKKRLFVISDHSDIRKVYTKKSENLGKVRDLNGTMVNGYHSLASIVADIEGTSVALADISVLSNKEERFVSQEQLKAYESGTLKEDQEYEKIEALIENQDYTNMTLSVKKQTQRVSCALKSTYRERTICHIHDRFCDSVAYFEHIDQTLKDEFVVRAKLSRNSNQTTIDAKGKAKAIKLADAPFAHQHTEVIEKLRIKQKLYQHATLLIEWDTLTLNAHTYRVVRITLMKRDKTPLYKKPMLLITNIPIDTFFDAKAIYHIYLMRSKIESVFKFLKEVLGWEEFQVRDWEAIKNLIALCFFVGNYFYEIESALIEHPTIAMICQLGNGKGVISRHFFLEGLKVLMITYNTLRLKEELGISPQEWSQMQALAGIEGDGG